MSTCSLYLNRDVDLDWLIALPFGHAADGRPEDSYRYVGEAFRWALDGPDGVTIGFEVVEFTGFDVTDNEHEELWSGARFDAPLVGLREATAGEILVAAQAAYGNEPTLNRVYFDRAVALAGTPDAIAAWRLCLECGDSMAHYGLGYSLLDAGRPHEAYAHLRYYAELVRANGWAWCYVGKACIDLGHTSEAREALERAVALEGTGGFETEAAELLAVLPASSRGSAPR